MTFQKPIPKQSLTVCRLTSLKKKSFFSRHLVAQLHFAVLMTLKGPYLRAAFVLKIQNLQKMHVSALISGAEVKS